MVFTSKIYSLWSILFVSPQCRVGSWYCMVAKAKGKLPTPNYVIIVWMLDVGRMTYASNFFNDCREKANNATIILVLILTPSTPPHHENRKWHRGLRLLSSFFRHRHFFPHLFPPLIVGKDSCLALLPAWTIFVQKYQQRQPILLMRWQFWQTDDSGTPNVILGARWVINLELKCCS